MIPASQTIMLSPLPIIWPLAMLNLTARFLRRGATALPPPLPMAHLAVPKGRKSVYTLEPSGGPMAKAKIEDEDTRTQRQKFIDAARELGTNDSEEAFQRVVRKIASAPGAKAKKAAKKPKR